MSEYYSGFEPPFEVYTTCCSYVRAYIRRKEWSDIIELCRSVSIKYKWQCVYRGFPPYWELYISRDNLTEEQLTSLKNKVPILCLEDK